MATDRASKVEAVAPSLECATTAGHGRGKPIQEEGGSLAIVVLGASGDLAKKKTFPALFALFKQNYVPSQSSKLFGYARSKLTDEDLQDRLRGYLTGGKTDEKTDPAQMANDFVKMIKYTAGGYDDDAGFQKLDALVGDWEQQIAPQGPNRRLFYMALPPSVYPLVAKMVRKHCMAKDGWTRVVIEKPFGKDLESAEKLSGELGELFTEDQLYRIDHYLGKEIVQNLLVMRFANRFLVPMWNAENISNVQIVFKEPFGTEGRGGYFDEFGIIRDIIQNHLMQVLCLVAMEKPVSLDPEDVRDEKVKVLKSIEVASLDDCVLGQYEGYTDDETVPKESNTPTFATIVLRINNERWDGVPFILRAGKCLDQRKAEVRIQFKDVAGDIFKCKKQGRNELVMRLQPAEAIYLKMTVKQPGLEMQASQSELDLSYRERYQEIDIPEAYERLLLDVIRGDQQHFLRRDELKRAWEIFTPLLHQIDAGKKKPVIYKQGGRGPPQSDELIKSLGFQRTSGYVWVPPALQ
jgi:glucose-6-phosphate 1-dehydrogenase